jgi:hypothetical protein
MEYKKYGKIHSKNRNFKVGDVVKWTPSYVSFEGVEARGLGIVVRTRGTKFDAYWTGDGVVREHCTFLPGSFVLQDLAPIPQVKEYVEKVLEKNC